jgi:hypothetical protein
MKDDLNLDGYVDGSETLSVSGRVLVPLDYDLRTQFGKINVLPVSDANGEYMYSQSTSSAALMLDLRTNDRGPLDYLGRLGAQEEIHFDEKVLIVYGVPDAVPLPDSVEGFGSLPPSMTVPIACTRLQETADVFP